MRQRFALWWCAVLPSTLLGHVFAYALGGRTLADAQHAYVAPLLELSLVALTALVGGSIVAALLRSRRFLALEQSLGALLVRLVPAQMLLYALLERAEGNTPTAAGFAAQLATALLATLALLTFARLLEGCERAADAAVSFVERERRALVSLFVSRAPCVRAHALAVRAGSARFQRPPPVR
ncbi:MAG: hypothetical protein KGN02_11340 [bacterium]|nr:hypothetical protein [bacterium]